MIVGIKFIEGVLLPRPARMVVAISLLATLNAGTAASEAETEFYTISVIPSAPTTSDLVHIEFEKLPGAPCDLLFNGVAIDTANFSVKISVEPISGTFTGCSKPDNFRFLVGRLSKGASYGFEIYEELPLLGLPLFKEEDRTVSFTVTTDVLLDAFNAETPQEGSVQSGVGVVRGWACDAQRIDVQFDDREPIEVAYGTSRADTMETCGDSQNGYGMVMNWSLLEPGNHTMKTFIDGREVREVEFSVSGLGEEFVKGLEGTYELGDFPGPGESVIVEWDEALQNFVIISRD
tara:strand:- start:507 stop:1379 length:873 start_codon:yes stop_codon:yes gene_type:complete